MLLVVSREVGLPVLLCWVVPAGFVDIHFLSLAMCELSEPLPSPTLDLPILLRLLRQRVHVYPDCIFLLWLTLKPIVDLSVRELCEEASPLLANHKRNSTVARR